MIYNIKSIIKNIQIEYTNMTNKNLIYTSNKNNILLINI
jgi:hypothetical protein